MHLRVENLGPLREATLDLTPALTVLTGPNHTGKTWCAWTVYALARAVERTVVALPERFCLTPETLAVTIPQQVFEPLAATLVADTAAGVQRDLPDVFASTGAFFEQARLQWTVPRRALAPRGSDTLVAAGKVWGLVVGRDEWLHAALHGMPVEMRLRVGARDGADDSAAAQGLLPPAQHLQNAAFSFLCRETLDLPGKPVLFPAERLAVNLFARELAASRTELVEEALAAEGHGQDPALILRRAGRFPLPIRDSLSTATRLDGLSRQESSFADLALELERSLLGGVVAATDRGELRFTPHTATVSLPVHMSASIVKSLASLTFYFRHLAEPGAFLVIDEPELNLHPDAQRRVARFLGRVINRGFKVMISTHSDFVVRELSHLVMLGSAGEQGLEVARELGYDPDTLLTADKVGAWLFEAGTATRIPVDATGFGVRTIDDEITRMNADSQRIYARLVG